MDKITEVTGDIGVAASTGDALSAQEGANDLASLLGRFAANIVEYLASLGDRLADVLGLIGGSLRPNTVTTASFSSGHWPQAVNS